MGRGMPFRLFSSFSAEAGSPWRAGQKSHLGARGQFRAFGAREAVCSASLGLGGEALGGLPRLSARWQGRVPRWQGRVHTGDTLLHTDQSRVQVSGAILAHRTPGPHG